MPLEMPFCYSSMCTICIFNPHVPSQQSSVLRRSAPGGRHFPQLHCLCSVAETVMICSCVTKHLCVATFVGIILGEQKLSHRTIALNQSNLVLVIPVLFSTRRSEVCRNVLCFRVIFRIRNRLPHLGLGTFLT